MKKFTKIMLSVAAVTAVSTAMAISAMAADTVTGTYNNDTGEVTLDGVVGSGAQQTLLVLNQDVSVTSENANDVIAQIDQQASISTFKLPAGLADDGDPEVTYYIRIGGSEGGIQTGTLVLNQSGGGEEPGGTKITIKVGDINLNGAYAANDGTQLSRYLVGYTAAIGKAGTEYTKADGSGEKVLVGDINLNGAYAANDGTQLSRYLVGYTAAVGKAGTEIEVYDNAE